MKRRTIQLSVESVDSAYVRAASASVAVIAEPADQFYSHSLARGADPSGSQLFSASNVKDVGIYGLMRMKRMVPLH